MFGKSSTQSFPASLNVYSVDENYGIIIIGTKSKIRLLFLNFKNYFDF